MESYIKPTGKPAVEVTLEGRLLALDEDGLPLMIQFLSDGSRLVMLFNSEEEMRELYEDKMNMKVGSIKQIVDQREFLESIPMTMNDHKVRIGIDVYFTPEGAIRWKDIQRDGLFN